MNEMLSETYRGYDIKQARWGWLVCQRFVAKFQTIEEARKAIDTRCDKLEKKEE
jgi:hypothetical protein